MDLHDVEAAERAESEIDRFISKRDRERKEASPEAALQKTADRRRREAYREENRALWIEHLRRRAGNYLALARDARSRARALEYDTNQKTTKGTDR